MFTDEHRVTVWNEIRQHDLRAFSRFLEPAMVREAAAHAGVTLGKEQKKGRIRKKSSKRSKHDPRRADPTVVSEEAFVKARQRVPLAFWLNLLLALFRTAGLKHLRKLGPKDRLVEYAPTDRKWRKAGLPRSMTLRVIDYQIPGFRPSAVVTNVTDPAVMSREDWVRLSTA